MTTNEHRAIELEFYCIIQLIYRIQKDANFLVSMLEGLRFIVPFDVEKIVNYANKFNWDVTWRPYQGEVVGILFKYSTLPMNAVCSALQISRPTGYRLADKYISDPIAPIVKVPAKDLADLKAVVNAYKTLSERMKNNG